LKKSTQKLNSEYCPICLKKSKPWVILTELTLLRCNCGHCFTNVNSIQKKEEYSLDYYKKTHKNWFENPNYRLFNQIAEEIKKNPNESILDVGCGDGAFLIHLKKYFNGRKLVGLDIAKIAPSEAGIIFLTKDFMAHNFNKKFDVIVTLAVIEHLHDVSSFVKKIYKSLNKEGTAYIMTINQSGILYNLANFFRLIGFKSFFTRLYDKHHLNHFSQKSLSTLLTKNGLFKITKLIDHNIPFKAVDLPRTHPIKNFILFTGIVAIFLLGKITKKSYCQTLIVKKI
jgi:2-polyprenyl-3-methyl-5-hydroxy-6-metoxy-1,4-benzoquinol methylase